jgi:flagellar hook-associated protein 2
MSTISSPGIGSGLDVNSIVTQLVAAERSAPDRRLATAQQRAQTQISALGNLRSVLSNLQTAANALSGSGNTGLGALSAVSSNTALYTATTTSKAVAGNYNVEVLALAAASKRSSTVFASSSAVVGNGDVTLTTGTRSFTVNLADGANTLADLRDKINAATDNTGVGAAIINDTNGARLLLTSRSTGLANALSVSTTLFTTSEVQPATDAQINVDGFTISSSSNQVTGGVDGITFNLNKAEPGTTTQLDVSVDNTASAGIVQSFVNSYNNVVRYINSQTAYNTTTRQAGTLLGDAATRAASQQLRSLIGGSVSDNGTYTTLSQLGITTSLDGTLQFDSSQLTTALNTDFVSVQRLFNGDNGVATRLSALADTLLSDDGLISAETGGLNARITDIGKSQDALDRRITSFEARTRAQFTALDTLLGQLSSTSTFLTQQLARLANL